MDDNLTPPLMDTSHIQRKWIDVAYANQSSAQKLDIYLPIEGDGPFPVILTIHGGAWMFGDKQDAFNLPFLEGLERGYAVVCLNYRLSDEAQFPCQIYDCKAALLYLRAHARQYLLDAKRIAAWGASAGGHLAALLGTTSKVAAMEDKSIRNTHNRTSDELQAVVVWYGPVENFLRMDEQLEKSGTGVPNHSEAESPESRLLGRKITDIPALVKFASPITYIKNNVPPFLIQHGLKDEIVPVEQSIHFAAKIRRVAGADRVSLQIFAEAKHGDSLFATPQNLKTVFDFLDLHLK